MVTLVFSLCHRFSHQDTEHIYDMTYSMGKKEEIRGCKKGRENEGTKQDPEKSKNCLLK